MLQLGIKSVAYSDDNGTIVRCRIENLENTVFSRYHHKRDKKKNI
jgi:hypothetical protein